jgi:hypothetical protein
VFSRPRERIATIEKKQDIGRAQGAGATPVANARCAGVPPLASLAEPEQTLLQARSFPGLFRFACIAWAALAILPIGCGKEKASCAPTLESNARSGEMASAVTPIGFTKRAPEIGSKTSESSTLRMNLSLTLEEPRLDAGPATTMMLATTETQKRFEETLAVNGDARTRVKVTYGENAGTLRQGAEGAHAAPRPSVLAGKTYIVAALDGRVVVTGEAGTKVSPVEAREVSRHYASLGSPDALVAAIPATAPPRGAPIYELSKALEEEISRNAEGMTVGNAIVRFMDADVRVATFDASFTLWKDEGPLRFTMNLKGTMNVRLAPTSIVSMDFNGPVTAAPRPEAKTDGAMKVTGSGTIEISVIFSP